MRAKRDCALSVSLASLALFLAHSLALYLSLSLALSLSCPMPRFFFISL